ncbi:hypothetical protein MAGR_23900 [Mycolicibacterium agri]|uniref:Uncharacterized protein n=1 Tax=Mycolicibacterium agri TaxID=36811 RepID=A0A7I9W0J6_MYCAG|nr:hypothetical protein MAGR_23900 [Mycolicibacterium agri]
MVAIQSGTHKAIPASGGTSTAHRRIWDIPLAFTSWPRGSDFCRGGALESVSVMRYLSIGTGVGRP